MTRIDTSVWLDLLRRADEALGFIALRRLHEAAETLACAHGSG